MSKRKQLVGIFALLILAAVTVLVVMKTASAADLRQAAGFLKTLHPVWIILSVLSALSCLLVEGMTLRILCRRLGYEVPLRESVMWASSDYYISGITPLATGGQPAVAYFMQRAGIPLSKSTLMLVFFTMQYQASMLVLGAPCLIVALLYRAEIPPVAVGMIVYGFSGALLLLIVCILCMMRQSLIRRVGGFFIRLFGKLHLLRNPQKKLDGLEESLKEYAEAFQLIGKDRGAVLLTLGSNVLLRAVLALPLCLMSLGLGLPVSKLALIFSLQILCVVGAASIPIPGTVGAAELIFTLLLRPLLGDDLVPVMLINRLLVFYLCVLVGGIWTWIRMIRKK